MVCAADPEVLERYGRLYKPNSWHEAEEYYWRCRTDRSGSGSTHPTQLSPLLSSRKRAEGAVVGGAVSDAAAMGVHWVYDLDLIAQLQEGREAEAGGADTGTGREAGLEFMEPPKR